MSAKRIWFVRFHTAKTEGGAAITTDRSPMIRSHALENAKAINDSGWRGWVEDAQGNRIYETEAETRFREAGKTNSEEIV